MTTIATLNYFANVDFYKACIKSENFEIESQENYQKQTFRNRCKILTSQGIIQLSVPIIKSENKFYRDIKIDFNQKWQINHWRSIQTAYGKSPYFEHYEEKIKKLIMTKSPHLFDFNFQIMSNCLEILKINKAINLTTIYHEKYDTIEFEDIRNKKLPIASDLEYIKNKTNTYYQSFGNEFVAGLSILDLIFNEGTNASNILYTY